MNRTVPQLLEEKIATLAPEVDYEIRTQLQQLMRTLRTVGYPIGVLLAMSRLSLQLLDQVLGSAGHCRPSDNLYDCILSASKGDEHSKLHGHRLLPDELASYLHTIRMLSNKADHAGEMLQLTSGDAENALNLYLRVVEWFYTEYSRGLKLESIYFASSAALPSVLAPNADGETVPKGSAVEGSVFQITRPTLPQQLTSFIGREREIEKVKRLLSSTRLLTLMGSGGCGKTRLALQVAVEMMDDFKDGVWLVELSTISEGTLIPQIVASALEVHEEGGRSITGTLLDHLKQKSLLLILDNCEHLVQVCASLVETLLRSCPNLHVLATSREALDNAGEVTFRVPSLSAPNPKRVSSLNTLMQYEAVRLFIDRAVAAQPSFTVTAENAPAVAQISHRLDGIPLAIELAAARVKMMNVEKIAERLDDRFRLLTGGRRTALPRQQTLRAAIDWSYDLLSEQEQMALRRVAVFAGGWTLEAAEAVCVGEAVEEWEVMDLLSSLIDKSLVQIEEQEKGSRFRLLETVRQYSNDRVEEAGEGALLRRCHYDYFFHLVDSAVPYLHGSEQTTFLDLLETEYDNVRGALEWCQQQPDLSAHGLRLAGSLWRFWYMRDYYEEGRNWISSFLQVTETLEVCSARANALRGLGLLMQSQGDHKGAMDVLSDSVKIFRKLGDEEGLARALGALGHVAWDQCDLEAARPPLEESLLLFRKMHDPWGIAIMLKNLGNVARNQEDVATAKLLFEESLSISNQVGDERGLASALDGLGRVVQIDGDYPSARNYFQESLTHWQQLGNRHGAILAIEGLAGLAATKEDAQKGACLLGAADALRKEVGAPLSPAERADHERNLDAIRVSMSEEAFSIAWRKGQGMAFDDAMLFALEV